MSEPVVVRMETKATAHRLMVTREMLGEIGDCSKPVQVGRYRWWLMESPQFGY
jgi:hypothetical protein